MYLNLIYLGHGNYGIESASEYYFNKPASKLTKPEAAMLIGILPNPAAFSPLNDLQAALERQALVLNSFVAVGKLDKAKVAKLQEQFKKNWSIKIVGNKASTDIGDFPDQAYKINRAPFF